MSEIKKLKINGVTYDLGGGGSGFDIHSLMAENAIADADELPFYDASAAAPRKTTWSNLKAKLKSYFDTLYLGTTALVGYATQVWVQSQGYGTYSKPSGGIPKSDLASAVQASLDKADTALQSHQDISGKSDVVISSVSNITPTQVATAISQGKTVVITASHATFGSLSFEAWNVATNFNLVISNATAHVFGVWATISLQGNLLTDSWETVSDVIATSQDVAGKLDISQGVSHAGEFLVVGADGNVTTMTLATWTGGDY